MSEIGAYEAKTHLPQLLERVRRGERFVITRHGQPVAELIPVVGRDVEQIRRAIASLRAIRKVLAHRGGAGKDARRPGQSFRELAHEGHRR
jgi:prevent-host-death family protein